MNGCQVSKTKFFALYVIIDLQIEAMRKQYHSPRRIVEIQTPESNKKVRDDMEQWEVTLVSEVENILYNHVGRKFGRFFLFLQI